MSYEPKHGDKMKPKYMPKVVATGKEIEQEDKRDIMPGDTTIAEDKKPGPAPTEDKNKIVQASEATGPLHYCCLVCPGDVALRNPDEKLPFCRYCGTEMVRVSTLRREKRERM